MQHPNPAFEMVEELTFDLTLDEYFLDMQSIHK